MIKSKNMKMKLKKEDQVKIIAGKDRGKIGKIIKVDRDSGKVVIQGLNMAKKAVKPRRRDEKGGIIDIEAPIDASNVMIICKRCGPTRVGYKWVDGNKVRKCKKCGDEL
ncbi:MAG: 50S ribosomal protein L24 [Spirochaetes bacterium]|nr:MAG: 50S ribosomal protein L24 [Spirochaetota bacterium]